MKFSFGCTLIALVQEKQQRHFKRVFNLGSIDYQISWLRQQTDDQAPGRRAKALANEREALVIEVRAKLAEIGDAELSGMFEAALIGGNMMVFRERTKTTIIKESLAPTGDRFE